MDNDASLNSTCSIHDGSEISLVLILDSLNRSAGQDGIASLVSSVITNEFQTQSKRNNPHI